MTHMSSSTASSTSRLFFWNGVTFGSTPSIIKFGTYVVQTHFNENPITGLVNGVSVQNMTSLRLGVWSACYTELHNPHWAKSKCVSPTGHYRVTITAAMDSANPVEVLGSFGTLILLFVQFAATFFPFAALFLRLWTSFHWVALCAAVSALVAIVADCYFFIFAREALQIFGGSVKTKPGSSLYFSVVALLFALGGWLWQWVLSSKDQAVKAKKEKDEEQANSDANFQHVRAMKIEGKDKQIRTMFENSKFRL